MPDFNVLIAAGGTGGHVYPAIAIADALKKESPDVNIQFVGTKDHMEWDAVPKAGYRITDIWISGFHRQLTTKNLLFPIKLITALIQSFLIIQRFRPAVVVSCGGYVAGPIGWMAARRNVPLVIQEQNGFPGVTNRLLAKYASRIFTAFTEADKHFPAERTQLTGNPTRNSLSAMDREQGLRTFGLKADQPVLLIMGGSGGAKSINDAVQKNLPTLCKEENIQVIWQCGRKYFDHLATVIELDDYPNLRLLPFIDTMADAYAVADLIVSRSGASSCSEFMLTGSASVLIPSPNVAGDHQTENAKAMENEGAAILLADKEASQRLSQVVIETIRNTETLQSMKKASRALAKPEAGMTIAKEILNIARERRN